MSAGRRIAPVALGLSLLAALAPGSAAAGDDGATRGPGAIENVVIVLEQNHTFDSYFGNYPGVNGYGGVTSWPTKADGTEVRPFIGRSDELAAFRPEAGAEPLANGSHAAIAAADGGTLRGFVQAQDALGYRGELSMATNDRSTAGVLWTLADDFVLFDAYHATRPGGSFTNMLELFTGSNQGIDEGTKRSLAEFAALAPPTVLDEVAAAGEEWRFYSDHIDRIDPEALLRGRYYDESTPTPSALYWAPFLNLPRVWQLSRDRLQNQSAFFGDAAQGTLPALSVVLPTPTDHPVSPEAGLERLRSIVNAAKKSPQWPNTVVLVVWDDWGGFYDHVVPPAGFGFRVPLLLISPLARQGAVSSQPYDHRSVLQFVRETLGVVQPPSSPTFAEAFADASAPLRNELLSGSLLPDPPVGTDRQNSQTVRLYLAALTVAVVAFAGALRIVSRPPRRTLTPVQRKMERNTSR